MSSRFACIISRQLLTLATHRMVVNLGFSSTATTINLACLSMLIRNLTELRWYLLPPFHLIDMVVGNRIIKFGKFIRDGILL